MRVQRFVPLPPHAIRRGRSLLAGAIWIALVAGPVQAYEHRTSTPSFGAQIGYGRIAQGDRYFIRNWPLPSGGTTEAQFDLEDTHPEWGASAHVGVRFVLDRSHALGFGFDDLRYSRKAGYSQAEREALPRWVKFTTFHADYYLYFQRRSRVCYYVAPFAGLQQRELRFKGSEVQTQEYRLLYGAGVGVEYFVRRSFSIDLGARVFSLRGGTGTTVLLQPALGVQFYVI